MVCRENLLFLVRAVLNFRHFHFHVGIQAYTNRVKRTSSSFAVQLQVVPLLFSTHWVKQFNICLVAYGYAHIAYLRFVLKTWSFRIATSKKSSLVLP